MTLVEHALRDPIVVDPDGASVRVGLPWYRSMPFSAVLAVELRVDGLEVPDVRLDGPGGHYWFLQDRCVLRWRDGPSRDRAEVRMRVRLHLPYLAGQVQVLQEASSVLPVERTA